MSGNPAGRPKGALNKATRDVKALCTELLESPTYVRNFRTRLNAGKLAPVVEALVWHYAYGKPKEQIELEAGGTLAEILAGRLTSRDP